MERSEQLKIVEALVLASPEPLSAARIAQIAPECTAALASDLVAELNEQYTKQERAFEIWEVAGGFQVRTRAEYSGYLQKLQKQRPLRLSPASLETLSIVAYKQPATRADIEQVRGVEAGAVLKGLLDRGLVKINGHKEVPGRPMLYGTTRRFLEVFGLESLKQMPVLRELEDLAREHGIAENGLPEVEPGEGEGLDESVAVNDALDAEAAEKPDETEEGDEPIFAADAAAQVDEGVEDDVNDVSDVINVNDVDEVDDAEDQPEEHKDEEPADDAAALALGDEPSSE